MNKKLLCLALAVVIVGTIFVSAYLASAAPQGKGNDRVLSKVKFIHYRKGYGKPAGTPGGGKGKAKDKDEGYYTYLAKGAKWKNTEVFYLNPANEDGVLEAVNGGMDEWETPGDTTLDIFGNVILKLSVSYDGGAYREYNTISFGTHDNPNVIAEATVWGYFGGPPSQREIVEAHILLNDDDIEWGDAYQDETLMDVQNIVTHELGHCAGMGDLYKTEATEETMYGISTEGETKKRDLYKGDINGITKLYE
ncbi:hypothetical protein ES707_17314 [subsurface metagenome]